VRAELEHPLGLLGAALRRDEIPPLCRRTDDKTLGQSEGFDFDHITQRLELAAYIRQFFGLRAGVARTDPARGTFSPRGNRRTNPRQRLHIRAQSRLTDVAHAFRNARGHGTGAAGNQAGHCQRGDAPKQHEIHRAG
jgi:hypothetical protein